jgi:hypothetical protein
MPVLSAGKSSGGKRHRAISTKEALVRCTAFTTALVGAARIIGALTSHRVFNNFSQEVYDVSGCEVKRWPRLNVLLNRGQFLYDCRFFDVIYYH